jgi:protein-disulfide isomerase
MSGYIRPGLIRFEFHEYPVLSQRSDGSFDTDGESWRAAEASLCANDQGQYWPYHDALYANSIGISQGSFTPDRLVEIARQVPALDIAEFQSCIVGRTQTSAVQELASQAMASGIDSTPTFVINGERIEGADWTAISEAIDDKLAETSPG